ncbi:MAG: hypothetical protein HPY52_16025 [Firmicutes bacterium]|nr:hypothetical protein [Bacillota bacterium]
MLFYNAVLSRELLQAHAEHYEILRARGIEHDPTYSPGNVLFHCTIAVDLEEEQLHEGINICLEHGETLEGSVENVELIEFFPAKLIHRRKLTAERKYTANQQFQRTHYRGPLNCAVGSGCELSV